MKEQVSAMAGYMRESVAWRMIYDLTREVPDKNASFAPECIAWNGEIFEITRDNLFSEVCLPPEGDTAGEKSKVWMLGATLFYLMMGNTVFNGRGGRAQKAGSPLPFMRKELPALSTLVMEMLRFDPSRRPSFAEITVIAEKNMRRLESSPAPRERKPAVRMREDEEPDTYWPEEMI